MKTFITTIIITAVIIICLWRPETKETACQDGIVTNSAGELFVCKDGQRRGVGSINLLPRDAAVEMIKLLDK
jgi:hypothetical protein